ncbi:transcription termination/antitermination protein NusA [bacterium]|jgi:transcription termination/antitermination protein NusA|nr:transcription termination/antitermination protein NusA [bacterium]
MILIDNFRQVTAQIESERGVPREVLISAIEQALVAACRRKVTEEAILEATIDPDSGEANIFQVFEVVDEVEDEDLHMKVEDARRKDPSVGVGSQIKVNITPSDFGRIAALTAKQVIVQRIREAEKQSIFEEFKDKIGTVLIGTVQRVEGDNYLVNLGRSEAILNRRDQIPGETLSVKEKVRVFLSNIDMTPRGPLLRISRSHPGLLKCLFHLEIPEISDGIIEVKSVSREPGVRAKVAVKSNNASIGAVGTCVGHLGGRIQSIIRELGREKIDVLEWSEVPESFIANALKPAKIADVTLLDVEEKTAVVVVAKDQLSLAIGKYGVNVRLSVKLTGWKLDIVSEEEYSRRQDEFKPKNQLSMADRIRLNQEANGENEEESGELSLAEKLKMARLKMEEEEASQSSEDEGLTIAEFSGIVGLSEDEIKAYAEECGFGTVDDETALSPEQMETLKSKIKNK